MVDGCPALKAYTDAEQDQAADELDRLGAGAVLARFMADYKGLRDQVRACREASKPQS